MADIVQMSQSQQLNIDDLGVNNPSWLSFLNGFKSRGAYIKRVNHFLIFYLSDQQNLASRNIEQSLIDYFQVNYDSGKYAPSTLGSWLAILKRFWLHTGRGDLGIRVPILHCNITKWGKEAEVKKAPVFSKSELLTYLNLPDTEVTLVRKVHAIVAIGVSGRSSEVVALCFEDFKKYDDHYMIRSVKKKSKVSAVAGIVIYCTVLTSLLQRCIMCT